MGLAAGAVYTPGVQNMIPFLHLGPITIPTFGLMMATALLVSAYVLQADFNRRRGQLERVPGYRGQRDEGFLIIGVAGVAGIAGAKLYHALQTPETFTSELFSRYGFAWFGGFLGGFIALVIMARRLKIPLLLFLDICSAAACVGYAIGRIGCFLSGDGDYGKPTNLRWPWAMAFPQGVVPTTETCVQWGWPADCRVYVTPLYEFFIWLAIAGLLWHLGTKSLRSPRPAGEIFCWYLILTGVARFLIEFIRINPRSFLGMSNAQAASLVSILVGVVLLVMVKGKLRRMQQRAA
jgi:phosphatidylglycerol---prolipoprotein diacylglyceryl transferase